MVKTPLIPRLCVVTCLATWAHAKSPLVKILVATSALSRQFQALCILDRMTGLASQLLMGASERVFGLPGMVEAPSPPRIWSVASCTARFHSETPLMIVVFVALLARGRRVLIGKCPMAFLAGHGRMQPNQRETRQIVIEIELAPVILAMTLLATRAQLLLMRILFFMTGYAGDLQLVPVKVARMARVAFGFYMGAAEREFGFIVIKPCVFPFVLIMARLAFWTVTTRVDILKTMAGIARFGEVLIDFTNMTGRAANILMGPLERKLCLAVIKWFNAAPFCDGVTSVAFLKSALMRIDSLMAIETHR
jgi:hypothetical protein